MKKIYFLLFLLSLIFNVASCFGQGGAWTWVSGSDVPNSAGVYGTQGVPSVNNHPPGVYEPCEWKDKHGNFWIYGGMFSFPVSYSDLWRYNPLTKEWTWVKGNGQQNQSPVYGTHGVANPSNTPGQTAFCAVTWVDTSGALWLFGGYDINTSPQNNLWKYDISSNEWTWLKGDSSAAAIGMHGTQGIPDSSNNPGGRGETCSSWTDSLNNLWLFGGQGYDDNGMIDQLNDLWKYDIITNEWTWMKGSAYIDAPGSYGTQEISDTSNEPAARETYTKWKDADGNFWLMGGGDILNDYNDVWKYDLSLNEWIWMSGSNLTNGIGTYNATCIYDTINEPYSRREQRASVTDNCHRFWLFGGFSDYSGYFLNDLWVYDPNQLEWNWVSGTNINSEPGNYGTLGITSSSNLPPSRCGADAWWGNDNKFYFFGGVQNWSSNLFYSDVWVFNPDTNCVPVSSCNAVAVAPPIADFQVSQASICANACINFTDLSTNATAWQWSFAGALDSTSTNRNPQNVCYSKAGIYNVTLIASNAAGSDTVTFSNYITVTPTPPTPVITQHQDHDTLYCSFDTSYYSFQWFYDSTLIAGATDTFLIISKSGNYNVQVSNKNGCSIAGGINVVLGVENYSNDNVVYIYPNPAGNKFTVYGLQFTVGRMEIYNLLGQEASPPASLTPGPSPKERGEATIDVSGLCSGIYFVRITNESGQWVGKFVKE